jgi:hypothetical protein
MKTWGRAAAAVVVMALGGCGDDGHTHDDEGLGVDACEHLEGGPIKAVTAGADAASATAAGDEHTRYDVALVDVGADSGGFLSVAVADAGEHVLFFDEDVTLVVTDGTGATVATTKATSDADCDLVKTAYTVDFSVGTYTLSLVAIGA